MSILNGFRGEILKQIIPVNDELKEKIIEIEDNSEIICKHLVAKYQPKFRDFDAQVVIELIRIKSGKPVSNRELLEGDYESFIEIGFDQRGEYYPNSRIPIWKCKTEWFQKIGYVTRRNAEQLEMMISQLVLEMMEDLKRDEK